MTDKPLFVTKLILYALVGLFIVLASYIIFPIPTSIKRAVFPYLIHGLFLYFFGNNFWDKIGLKDEPVFFFLAIIVFPILFLIGLTGSVAMFVKDRKQI